LASLLQAPVTAHRSGKGIVSDDSPYALDSVAAYEYWKDADLLIGIGSRLELQHFRWRWLPQNVKTVRIDIDPTEMVRLKPHVGIVADASAATAALADALTCSMGPRVSKAAEFAELRARAHVRVRRIQPQMGYLDVIRDVLPRDGFFVEEICQAGFTSRLGFPVYAPRRYVTCGYQDNLGFGFNTALGVKVANPEKAVISICGDGGFLFGSQELATAVQQRIALVTVVFNNRSYGNVRRDQMERYQGRTLGADLVNPDFIKFTESFGALALRAESPGELRSTLQRALEAETPTVIEVPIAPGVEASPWELTLPAPHGS
jgi:acetolactate synthase-1/2/3 large subunit